MATYNAIAALSRALLGLIELPEEAVEIVWNENGLGFADAANFLGA